MKRIICWTIGHRWFCVRRNPWKHLALCHISDMAGRDCICLRCHQLWADSGWHFWSWLAGDVEQPDE